MNNPTAVQVKHLLAAYPKAAQRANLLRLQIQALGVSEAEAYAASVTQMADGMPRTPAPANKTAAIATQQADADERQRQRLEGELAVLTFFEHQMKIALGSLPEESRDLVRCRYINGLNWTQTVFKMADKYPLQSERNLRRKIKQALHHIAALLVLQPGHYAIITRI